MGQLQSAATSSITAKDSQILLPDSQRLAGIKHDLRRIQSFEILAADFADLYKIGQLTKLSRPILLPLKIFLAFFQKSALIYVTSCPILGIHGFF